MRRTMIACVPLLLILTGSFAPSASGGAADSSRQGWPATRVGRLSQGWVAAFCAGESAMRDFLAREMAPNSLKETGVSKRVERYRDLREKYGRLELVSVVKSEPGKLTVKLMDADGSPHDFVFTAQAAPPFKLVSVGIVERSHFGHGFGGWHR